MNSNNSDLQNVIVLKNNKKVLVKKNPSIMFEFETPIRKSGEITGDRSAQYLQD